MARENIIHELEDWSSISGNLDFPKDIDISCLEHSLGIHRYDGTLWTGGYVGVGRLVGRNGNFLQTKGREHILVIKPKRGVVDPWKMLEVVLADEEYGSYVQELEKNGKFLFKVFYDQPVIKLSQNHQTDSNLLYAISFISSCYALCKKGLRKEMIYEEENYSSKVKGKINVKKNIRENTCRGRNDRFYCKFIDFTGDNVENRILKAALIKSKKIVGQKVGTSGAIYKQYQYCINTFRHVKDVQIKASDFAKASAFGLYMYYKPVLKQAKAIIEQKNFSFKATNGESITRSVYTTPYVINMETLFEFYVRSVFRKILPPIGYELVDYSEKVCLEDGIDNLQEVEKGIHLIPYCIPDIIIRKIETNDITGVMDVKYKDHRRSSREDSHQLLSYVLLTGAKKCGFIFPESFTKLKLFKEGTEQSLKIRTSFADEIKYYELLLGQECTEDEMTDLMRNILSV